MRLLLDMGLPRRCAADLTAVGVNTSHVAILGRERASDAEILELARIEDRVIATLDRDFARLLAFDGQRRPSVIHLRVDALDRDRATRLLSKVVRDFEGDLTIGSLVVVTAKGIRTRALPIQR